MQKSMTGLFKNQQEAHIAGDKFSAHQITVHAGTVYIADKVFGLHREILLTMQGLYNE